MNMQHGILTGKVEAVLKKLYSGTPEEVFEKVGLGHMIESHKRSYRVSELPGMGITVSPQGTGWQIRIGVGPYDRIKFYLSTYPACCGIRLFHNFSVVSEFPQEHFDQIMEAFFSENVSQKNVGYKPLGVSNRIEVVMVERGSRGIVMDATMDIEPIENPRIEYQPFWNFFHKYARKVRDRLQYNENSRNILHVLEVIF